MNRILATLAVATASTLLVSSCSASSSNSDPSSDRFTVVAAFYPLQFVADAIAGDDADVLGLAKPGVEPHDLELSPAAVREVQSADLVLYLSHLQPAVDDAIASTGVSSLDAATVVPLVDHGIADEDTDHEHANSEPLDPHFWLDPTLLAEYAEAVAESFEKFDPIHADAYARRADDLTAQLADLDAAYEGGLANCERQDIFTTHEAFAYLADEYGLHQVGLAGIDPEAEPSPARIRDIQSQLASTGATTMFTESLVSPHVAEALAADAGVKTAVLDPIESVTGEDDYISVMTRNLETLRTALSCE